jgi:rod shape-determining protein MreD
VLKALTPQNALRGFLGEELLRNQQMQYLIMTAVILASVVLQSILLNHLTIVGAKPDLILLVVVFLGLFKGSTGGAMAGFCGGLIYDLMSSSLLGLNALSLTLVGFLVGLIHGKVYGENIVLQVVLAFAATLMSNILFFLLSAIFHLASPLGHGLGRIILPAALYNICLVLPIFWVMRKFLGRYIL